MELKPAFSGKLVKKLPYPIRRSYNLLKIGYYNKFKNSKVAFNSQNLFWYNNTTNFGDWIGPYLYTKITGQSPNFKSPSFEDGASTTMSVGSIINLTKKNCVIWGSGIMSRDTYFCRPFKTLAVRGPITKKRFEELGYPCPEIYGDPAVLLPNYYNPDIKPLYRIGLIPHHVDLKKISDLYQNMDDVSVISVLDPVEEVIRNIKSCSYILSSSLHGVILGHAYRLPTAWAHFSFNLPGDDIKFYDYFLSIHLDRINKPLKMIEDQPIKAADLEKLILNYPQPGRKLIDTKALLDACPFEKSRI